MKIFPSLGFGEVVRDVAFSGDMMDPQKLFSDVVPDFEPPHFQVS